MLKFFAMVIFSSLLSSCYSIPPTTVPITTIEYSSKETTNNHLLVFMVGIGDEVSAFEEAGFFNQLQNQDFDAIAVDSHFGYYKEHNISKRIYEDILNPNRDRYKKITILGISLGGYGAIKTASDYPEFVNELILIAPFLGSRKSAEALAELDSLDDWPVTDNVNLGYFEDSWLLLHKVLIEQETPITLAFGKQDKFAMQSNQLAKYLQDDDVVRIDGSHNWQTWSNIWNKLLTLKMI